MYLVQGRIRTRRSPESLIGMYGLFKPYQPSRRDWGPAQVEFGTYSSFVGSEEEVFRRARRLGALHGQSQDQYIEEITTGEQAEKYLEDESRGVNVKSRSKPEDLGALLDAQAPEGHEIRAGQARLWHERRFPTPYAYILALGSLVREVEYSPEVGWQDKFCPAGAGRIRAGLFVPGFELGAHLSLGTRG